MEKRGNKRRRSGCPICAALDIFGDKWSLLIIRDIMIFGKTTYKEFLESGEGIASNILADRLILLAEEGLIKKTPHPSDRRKDVYTLTSKGIALLPMIAEMMLWSVEHNKDLRIPVALVRMLKSNRDGALRDFRKRIRRGEPLL